MRSRDGLLEFEGGARTSHQLIVLYGSRPVERALFSPEASRVCASRSACTRRTCSRAVWSDSAAMSWTFGGVARAARAREKASRSAGATS